MLDASVSFPLVVGTHQWLSAPKLFRCCTFDSNLLNAVSTWSSEGGKSTWTWVSIVCMSGASVFVCDCTGHGCCGARVSPIHVVIMTLSSRLTAATETIPKALGQDVRGWLPALTRRGCLTSLRKSRSCVVILGGLNGRGIPLPHSDKRTVVTPAAVDNFGSM